MAHDPLVSTDWVHERLSAPDVKIVDATWFLPGDPRDAAALFEQAHIPGAVFFDIDGIADEASPYPHMLPSPIKFASRARKLGLGDGSRIVVYDSHGLFSAPRVWWTFRAMGHEDVVVLDGGLPKWIAEGRPITDGPAHSNERHFTPRLNSDLVRDLEDVRAALTDGRTQIVDARSAERFTGEAPEPRPGLKSGHMPGARNIPWQGLLGPDGAMLSAERLRPLFDAAGVDLSRPVVATCGSGISASVLALALMRLGVPRASVYDGSWAEWGAQSDTPVVAGQA